MSLNIETMNLLLSFLFTLTVFSVVKGFQFKVTNERISKKSEDGDDECWKKLKRNSVHCDKRYHEVLNEANGQLSEFHNDYLKKVEDYRSTCEDESTEECFSKMEELEDWIFKGYEKIDDYFEKKLKFMSEECIKFLSDQDCNRLGPKDESSGNQ